MGLKKAYDDLQKFQLKNDSDGSIGVQYDDGSPGVLRTPNAGAFVESDGTPSTGTRGVGVRWEESDDVGRLLAEDVNNSFLKMRVTGSPLELQGHGGLIDASISPADLRLATGQAIEDDSGTERILFGNGFQQYRDDAGRTALNADNSNSTSLVAYSDQPVAIRDNEQQSETIKYNTSASAPGTLELKNANLQISGDNIIDILGRGRIFFGVNGSSGGDYSNAIDMITDQGTARLRARNNGTTTSELVGQDSDGNRTTLT